MNKSEKAPREFWIIDETPYSTWVSSKPLHSADTNEEIHVIEYFAFAEAQKLNEKYRLALEKIAKEYDDDLVYGYAREALGNKGEG